MVKYLVRLSGEFQMTFKNIKTAEDLAQDAIDAKAEQVKAEAQQYLNETDWIVTKISEIQLAGGDVEALKVKYATELSERKLMRELI
jgi:transcriptional/translational regulatory protein YebC/TACO1